MDLRAFDLNLLVVLHTLLLERSVSKTAERLHLSQPATSAALNRLRTALNDPILVRDGLRMVPTPRAEQLAEPVQAILAEIEQTLAAPKPFDPSTIGRRFRIATNDYGAFILVPQLMNRLQAIAPGIDIEIWEIAQDVEASLRQGEVDLVVADAWALRHCKCTETLFPETFTCLVRQNHPRIQTQLTLEHYLKENHALVSARGRVTGNVDIALAQQELQRHVRVTLPHILAIPAVIASTDLIVTLATRIANRLATDYALKTFPPPIALDGFDIGMAWQNCMANDPAIQWLRGELMSIGQRIMIQMST
ncbi:MAG: LysR family transcriptional regulator [Xenococcaceae cyanobacterium]